MFRKLDRTFGVLLLIGTCGHTLGTLLMLPALSGMWVWSLGASLAGAVLGTLNLVRAGRPADKTLAVITTIGTGLWGLMALAFGMSIHNIFDPRALFHFLVSWVLVFFGPATIRTSSEVSRRSDTE
ncbi:MAG: hypothetical protein JO061_08400 [Acidobacteriaceae bacterium]|nr:hypothetical protein [Acidobacteriaceae bacterium]